MSEFVILPAAWPEHAADILAVRRAVFVVEQGVPESLEVDGRDATARHLLARDGTGLAIGCVRLLPDAHIGRLAVRAAWRDRGVGRALLQGAVTLAREAGLSEVCLHAQCQAQGFYADAGFVAQGVEFQEAGIAHVLMRLALLPAAAGV